MSVTTPKVVYYDTLEAFDEVRWAVPVPCEGRGE
jgi:hypothetical protein